MEPKKETKTKVFEKPSSIDDIFASSFELKSDAIALLNQNRPLTEEEKITVARAVYETTFAKLFDADYSRKLSDKSGTYIGAEAREIENLLRDELRDYFGDNINMRFARPAWWFGADNLWTLHSESSLMEMTGLNCNHEKSIREAFERYKADFDTREIEGRQTNPYSVYLKSNIDRLTEYSEN